MAVVGGVGDEGNGIGDDAEEEGDGEALAEGGRWVGGWVVELWGDSLILWLSNEVLESMGGWKDLPTTGRLFSLSELSGVGGWVGGTYQERFMR